MAMQGVRIYNRHILVTHILQFYVRVYAQVLSILRCVCVRAQTQPK